MNPHQKAEWLIVGCGMLLLVAVIIQTWTYPEEG